MTSESNISFNRLRAEGNRRRNRYHEPNDNDVNVHSISSAVPVWFCYRMTDLLSNRQCLSITFNAGKHDDMATRLLACQWSL